MRFEFSIPVVCPCSCNVKIHSEYFIMKNTSFLQRHRRNLKVDEPSFQLNTLEPGFPRWLSNWCEYSRFSRLAARLTRGVGG